MSIPPKSKRKRKTLGIFYESEDNESQWTPNNWQEILDNIREMRREFDAPVDEMGCEKCVNEKELPITQRFHSLVSLMLSSQTKDQTTHAAVQRLQQHGLTVENIVHTDETTLAGIIYPVSFWKTKAKHIKQTAKILLDEYQGDIPDTVEGLCKLPGVGPKMAHICMQVAWRITSGIGVDTHVHRIVNRIGFVQMPTSKPESTRISLESWLPKELWPELNLLLVGFGQQICKPVSPKCAECLNFELCPFAKTSKKKK